MAIPIEIEQISIAREGFEGNYDLKYSYNYKRNILPVESRFSISLEGLNPDPTILRGWTDATRNILVWAKALNPDYFLLTGRSSEITARSLDTISSEDDNIPVVVLGAKENDLLYKDATSSLITDEDFWLDYNAKGHKYWGSFLRRRKFLQEFFSSRQGFPRHIVILDELLRNGQKARFTKEFLIEQGIVVDFGAIVGPIETPLAKLGSSDPNLYKFIGNLTTALVGIRDRQSLGKKGIGYEADQQALQLEALIDNLFVCLKGQSA